QAYPVLKDVYDRMAHVYENVVVPISDGIRVFQVVTNLKATAESEGRELSKAYEKTVVLATIDESWKEHLREMDELKQSVQAATYEQKDPLLIYKFESFELFKAMINKVNKDVVSTLMKGHIPTQDPEQVREAKQRRQIENLKASKSDFSQYGAGPGGGPDRDQKTEPVRVEKKVGRNDPCPCGSGKKYKHCHGQQQAVAPRQNARI
ncbi:MAG: preprotein translocase subunit SecA, partial [Bacteroidales bacterium]|nr:preprotein translocase subunit SecA [Bacteroidales bacterium]